MLLYSITKLPLLDLCNTEVDYHLAEKGRGLVILQNPCTKFPPGSSSTANIEYLEEVAYRVSPHSLAQASPFFRHMYYCPGENFESYSHYGKWVVRLDLPQEWDPAALLIILQICHFEFENVPVAISNVEFLGKIVAIADYLVCLDILNPFVEKWMSSLGGPWKFEPDTLPGDIEFPSHFADVTSVRESTIWMFVCSRLSLDRHFKKACISLVFNSKGPLDCLGLSFDYCLLAHLKAEREERLRKFFRQIDLCASHLVCVEGDEGLEKQSRLLYLGFLADTAYKSRKSGYNENWEYHGGSLKENLIHFWTKKREITVPNQMQGGAFANSATSYFVDMLQAVESLGQFEGLDVRDYF